MSDWVLPKFHQESAHIQPRLHPISMINFIFWFVSATNSLFSMTGKTGCCLPYLIHMMLICKGPYSKYLKNFYKRVAQPHLVTNYSLLDWYSTTQIMSNFQMSNEVIKYEEYFTNHHLFNPFFTLFYFFQFLWLSRPPWCIHWSDLIHLITLIFLDFMFKNETKIG